MYLKSVNYKNICFRLSIFVVNFLCLIAIVFTGIYFFFECSNQQNKQVEKDVLAYKSILNRQYVLKNKLDTLYYHMSLLNADKVQHEIFLAQYIAKNMNEIKKLVNDENEENFTGYALLLGQLDSLLIVKGQLIEVTNQESLALKDLNECIDHYKSVYTELSDDPSRKFTRK